MRAFFKRRWPALLLLVAYVGTVVAANWLTDRYGFVAAGFGLLVPIGTYTAGLALGLRDGLQDASNVRWVLGAIVAGTAVSFVVSSPAIAVASGVAFLVAEVIDLLVYTPLRNGGRRKTAVVLSNTVGAAVDTAVFLTLAASVLGPWQWPVFWGQMLVKAGYCTLAYLAVRYGVPWVWWRLRRTETAPVEVTT
jgi:uncharacterized PurR-regulated membrane protein YhhQ (DUF165 family)